MQEVRTRFLDALKKAQAGTAQVLYGEDGEGVQKIVNSLCERVSREGSPERVESELQLAAQAVLGMPAIFGHSGFVARCTTQEVDGSSRVFTDLAAVTEAAREVVQALAPAAS